jgi:Ubinuclein conserved middle domain
MMTLSIEQKFLYKQIGPLRIDELQTEIDGMITVLKQQVDEAMPAQIKQHAEIVASKFFDQGSNIVWMLD